MSFKYKVYLNGQYEKTRPIREKDSALIDLIIDSNAFTNKEILQSNRCRLYLQVQNILEITNGLSTHIGYCCAINHIKDPDQISQYQWPTQPKPPKKDWDSWDTRALLQVWGINEQYLLHEPLGQHILPPKNSTPWQYHPSSETLYYKTSAMSFNSSAC